MFWKNIAGDEIFFPIKLLFKVLVYYLLTRENFLTLPLIIHFFVIIWVQLYAGFIFARPLKKKGQVETLARF